LATEVFADFAPVYLSFGCQDQFVVAGAQIVAREILNNRIILDIPGCKSSSRGRSTVCPGDAFVVLSVVAKAGVDWIGWPMGWRSLVPRLLIVHHTPSPATRELLEAVLAGANDPDIEGVEVVARPALAATVPDVLDADGYLFGTPANLGYMSGALKHFFDTVYYPTLDHVAGRPYGLWVHGNNDTVGAVSSVEKVVTGLSLAKVADALEITGAIDAGARERAYQLGGTLAATLME